ncbi:AMP-binding protein [Burkholderia singularis]|uniref:AMP-binding protein n=1 Tax=Burkholderia singularis TaxID=1503053 RepID=UPI000A96DE06|nr:AMP-binding protein [Burkholderia singularis]
MTKCASTIHRLIEALENVRGAQHQMTFVDDSGNDASITYRQFAQQVCRHACALHELGVRDNDIVLLALPASIGHAVAMMACVMTGALPCTVPPATKRATASRQVVDVACELYRPRLVIAADATAPAWREGAFAATRTRVIDPATLEAAAASGAHAPISAKAGRDPHHIQLTSGSTSYPKAAVLSHENVISNVLGIGGSVRFDIERGDGTVSWLPLYHDMGLLTLLSNMHYRAPLVMMQPNSFIRNPLGWLKRIAAARATTTSAPTFALRYCVRRFNETAMQDVDLSACRNIFIGGERVDHSTLRDFATTFARYGLDASALQPCYGMAESTLAVSMHRAWHESRIDGAPYVIADSIDKRAMLERQVARRVEIDAGDDEAQRVLADHETVLAMGTPIDGMAMRIVGPDGAPRPERGIGEVAIRGTSLMLGYLKPDDGTIDAPLTADGWFATGDVGYVSDGQLHILGRKKEIIIVRGSNYFPHEIEDAILVHPALRKSTCIAFGVADAVTGTERVVVVVEARPADATLDTRLACQQLLAARIGFAAQDLCFVEPGSLPRTTSGKLQRLKCRDLYVAGALPTTGISAATADPRFAPPTAEREPMRGALA